MSAPEITVSEWPSPRGYANGRAGEGRPVHIAGQIGWDEHRTFVLGGLAPQFGKALDNVLAVVRAAGGTPEDIASMTVFVTAIDEYRRGQSLLGPVWRERMGRHYPAMALVAVSALVEPEAVVEIQAIAYVREATP
ncbi:MAG: RidA family protein [Myxococcota bacterium]|nr:RidA family protein [Myxococcota bacterium]